MNWDNLTTKERLDRAVRNFDIVKDALWKRMDHHSEMFMKTAKWSRELNDDFKELIEVVDIQRRMIWLAFGLIGALTIAVATLGLMQAGVF